MACIDVAARMSLTITLLSVYAQNRRRSCGPYRRSRQYRDKRSKGGQVQKTMIPYS
jgi:hypothetical protein